MGGGGEGTLGMAVGVGTAGRIGLDTDAEGAGELAWARQRSMRRQ